MQHDSLLMVLVHCFMQEESDDAPAKPAAKKAAANGVAKVCAPMALHQIRAGSLHAPPLACLEAGRSSSLGPAFYGRVVYLWNTSFTHYLYNSHIRMSTGRSILGALCITHHIRMSDTNAHVKYSWGHWSL